MSARATKALYVGYTSGTKNHGDEALMWIIRDLLAPEIEVVFDTEDYDVALLGGGTLINQSPWLIDEFRAKLDKAGRGVVFGTGVGDLLFWGNTFDRWIPLLNRCEAVGVRGPLSKALLQENGFDKGRDVGDPYLWLSAPVMRSPVEKHLGVNIGSTNNALLGLETDSQLCDAVAQTLQTLEKRGWRFSFLSVWEKDIGLLEDLRSQLQLADRYPLLDARRQPLEAFSMLAGCHVFLGEKLHANAMAAVAGTPFICLEYQPKVRDFAASLKMEKYVISTAACEPAMLVDSIEALASQHESTRQALAAARQDKRNSLIAFAREVKRLLNAEVEISG